MKEIIFVPMILLYVSFGVLLIADSWKCRKYSDAFETVGGVLVGVFVLIGAATAVVDVWFGG